MARHISLIFHYKLLRTIYFNLCIIKSVLCIFEQVVDSTTLFLLYVGKQFKLPDMEQ